ELKCDEWLLVVAGDVDLADNVVGGERVSRAHESHEFGRSDGLHDRTRVALCTGRLSIDPDRVAELFNLLDQLLDAWSILADEGNDRLWHRVRLGSSQLWKRGGRLALRIVLPRRRGPLDVSP